MSEESTEIETDPAELVKHLAYVSIVELGSTEPAKAQLRMALEKMIDERIAKAMK